MSELENAKQLLEGIKSDNEQLKKSVTDLENAKTPGQIAEVKERQDKIEEKMTLNDEAMEKMIKSMEAAKAKTQAMSGLDQDTQKRKEFSEFANGLRSIARNEKQHFETEKFKSFTERKDYNSGDDALGGVTVIPFLDSMIDKLVRQFSPIRDMASTVSISTDMWKQIKMNQTNGALWEKDMVNFVNQTKNNNFSELTIAVENLHAIATFTDDLINDSAFDIVGEILTSIAEDYAIQEGLSFWNGNGTGEMSGILNAPDATDSFDGIQRITSEASQSVTLDDVYNLIGALKLPYEQGAQFKAHRLGITDLRKLKDLDGQYLWQPSNIVGVPATLAGFPISQAPELASDINAAGAEGVVFGNFSKAYKIVDRMGMTVLRDNLTVYPNVSYKVKKRVGGGVSKGEALKILKTQA